MEEYLDSLVYPVHNVHPKEMVLCEGLFVLTLKAINVMRPCGHCSGEVTFCSEVIPSQPHKVSGAVAELLIHGDHIDALIQELARFVPGESVLAHGEQDLDSHCSLMRVCWSF